MRETRVFILRETTTQSWLSDLGTFATFAALIGLGRWLGSEPMQWAGLIIGFVVCLTGLGRLRRESECTPQEAADRLRREFGVVGRDD